MAILEIKNLTKNFGELGVLKGIDFSLDKGEVIAIIGSSGSGKSTLLRCLNFLEKPTSGEILLNNESIIKLEPKLESELDKMLIELEANMSAENDKTTLKNLTKQLKMVRKEKAKKSKNERKLERKNAMSEEEKRQKRLHFGLVFQDFNLFPHKNVLQNVLLAPTLILKDRKKAEKLSKTQMEQEREKLKQNAISILERVGLGEKVTAYPCELSGGQQQRVAIARALALKPDVLCFDEPTSALDPELTNEVLKVIKDLKSMGSTMIVVTHEMEFAKNVADKIIYMADGVIEEMASSNEIFSKPKSEKTMNFLKQYFQKV